MCPIFENVPEMARCHGDYQMVLRVVVDFISVMKTDGSLITALGKY